VYFFFLIEAKKALRSFLHQVSFLYSLLLLILALLISFKDLTKLLDLALGVGLLDKTTIIKNKATIDSKALISIIYKKVAEFLYRVV
jgi:hypothetical protein